MDTAENKIIGEKKSKYKLGIDTIGRNQEAHGR